MRNLHIPYYQGDPFTTSVFGGHAVIYLEDTICLD